MKEEENTAIVTGLISSLAKNFLDLKAKLIPEESNSPLPATSTSVSNFIYKVSRMLLV